MRANPTLVAVLAALSLVAASFVPVQDTAATQDPKKIDPTLGLNPYEPPADWTEAKAELGKKLFFDKRLSSDDSTSCETCHLHEYGWTNGQRFSKKVNGKTNARNSPSLYNVAYQPWFYWDGRAPTLEKNVAAAWKGHMGVDGDEHPAKIASKLSEIPGYAKEFEAAFGEAPTGDNIVSALAHFVRTLHAGGTDFDRYFKLREKDAISAEAVKGMQLYVTQGCATCHQFPMMTNWQFHNAGIGMDAEDPDLGRGKYDKTKIGAFKVPSLRGVELTAPYFHDGSVATLREAVKLMAGGGIDNKHKDPILQNRNLSDEQIDQIVAFLKTLTPKHPFTPPELPAGAGEDE